MHGTLLALDVENKKFKLKGTNEIFDFDKFLLACGSFKRRLAREYTNVFYLEDR